VGEGLGPVVRRLRSYKQSPRLKPQLLQLLFVGLKLYANPKKRQHSRSKSLADPKSNNIVDPNPNANPERNSTGGVGPKAYVIRKQQHSCCRFESSCYPNPDEQVFVDLNSGSD